MPQAGPGEAGARRPMGAADGGRWAPRRGGPPAGSAGISDGAAAAAAAGPGRGGGTGGRLGPGGPRGPFFILFYFVFFPGDAVSASREPPRAAGPGRGPSRRARRPAAAGRG